MRDDINVRKEASLVNSSYISLTSLRRVMGGTRCKGVMVIQLT
jgi:hypothetical protein